MMLVTIYEETAHMTYTPTPDLPHLSESAFELLHKMLHKRPFEEWEIRSYGFLSPHGRLESCVYVCQPCENKEDSRIAFAYSLDPSRYGVDRLLYLLIGNATSSQAEGVMRSNVFSPTQWNTLDSIALRKSVNMQLSALKLTHEREAAERAVLAQEAEAAASAELLRKQTAREYSHRCEIVASAEHLIKSTLY